MRKIKLLVSILAAAVVFSSIALSNDRTVNAEGAPFGNTSVNWQPGEPWDVFYVNIGCLGQTYDEFAENVFWLFDDDTIVSRYDYHLNIDNGFEVDSRCDLYGYDSYDYETGEGVMNEDPVQILITDNIVKAIRYRLDPGNLDYYVSRYIDYFSSNTDFSFYFEQLARQPNTPIYTVTSDGFSYISGYIWNATWGRFVLRLDTEGRVTASFEQFNSEFPIGSVCMYRLYNPNSGEHFYTASYGERYYLISLGWNDEGIGWIAPATSNTPVYRLYNSNGGEHHYTTSVAERDMLVGLGWNDEGIGWYSDDNRTVPLYRQYNPNSFANNHNYTTSLAENDWLVSLGWQAEGIGWYGFN